MNPRARRSIDIFNFSFLDVLACTIGLLIFIMVMVFVLQSGTTALADTDGIVVKIRQRMGDLEARAAADNAMTSQLEQELSRVASLADRGIVEKHRASAADRDRAAADVRSLRDALASAEARLNARSEAIRDMDVKLPAAENRLREAQERFRRLNEEVARFQADIDRSHVLVRRGRADDAGADSSVLHVDCQATRVVVMRIPPGGKVEVLGTTAKRDIDLLTSDLNKLLDEHQKARNAVVVFWVREDALATFSAAVERVPTGMTLGYEPALASWQFAK